MDNSNVSFTRIALLFIVLATIICCLSCISRSTAPVEPQPNEQPAFNLQAPNEMAKSMSYSDSDRLLLGIEYDPLLPTNQVGDFGNYMLFRPHYDPETHPLFNGMAYAIYNFNVAGYTDDPTVSYNWFSNNSYADSLWLGMANWDTNVWEWFRCDETEELTLPTMVPYMNASGNVLVAMVAYDPDQGTAGINYSAMKYVRLGPRVGRWLVDTVDPDSTVQMVSLAVDSDYIPHIAYNDFEFDNTALMYASLRMGWAPYVIHDAGDTGWYPSIILQSDGEHDLPMICFRSNTENDMRIATSTYRDIMFGDEALDWSEGYLIVDAVSPHAGKMIPLNESWSISYHNYDDKSLNYVYFNGLDWVNNIVDDSADVGFANWLAVNSAGRPCISYRNEDTQSLMYAEHTGMAWETSVIDPGAGDDIGMVSNLVFAPDGTPQVCYDDLTHGSTLYAFHDGADWQTEAVFDLDAHGQNKAMVVDSAGIPHVAVMDSDHNNLIHLWNDPTGDWLSETLDFGGAHPTGYCVAMAIDDRDRLYIAYGGNAGAGAETALKFTYQVD